MKIVGIIEFDNNEIKSYFFDSRLQVITKMSEDNERVQISFYNNECYIDEFYGKNTDELTINVGENGSGKTRLIRKIFNYINKGKKEPNSIYFFKKNQIYYFNHTQNFSKEIDIVNESKYVINDERTGHHNYKEGTKAIFFSNSFESSLNIDKNSRNDFSITYNLMKNEGVDYENFENSLVSNQIDFIFNNIIKADKGGITERFRLNSIINLTSEVVDTAYDEYFYINSNAYKYLKEESDDICAQIFKNNKNEQFESFFKTMNKQYQYNNYVHINEYFYKYFNEIKEKVPKSEINQLIISKINKMLSSESKGNEQVLSTNVKIPIEDYFDFIENIKIEYDRDNTFTLNLTSLVSEESSLLNLNKFMLDKDILKYFVKSWKSISAGTTSLLNLFSTLNDLSEEKNDELIVLLDEVDITLHPDWQKKFINELLLFINEIFKETSLQIILTTHSPLVLSDIRKDDVNFLSKNNSEIEMYTFGANLNELMSESFFLSDGLMGDFSKGVIKTIISKINGDVRLSQFEVNQIYIIIEEIGEIFIKNSLIKNMKSSGYYKVNENFEDRRKYLENELNKINEELKELNKNSGEVR